MEQKSKEHKERVRIIFYKEIEDNKYETLLFLNKEKHHYQDLRSELRESDSFSYVLAAARCMIIKIHPLLVPENLQEEAYEDESKKFDDDSERQSELDIEKLNHWYFRLKHDEFFYWVDFISEQDFVQLEQNKSTIVFLKYNDQFENSLQTVQTPYQQYDVKSIEKQQHIDKETKAMFRNMDLAQLIEEKNYYDENPQKRVLLFLNPIKKPDVTNYGIQCKGLFFGIYRQREDRWATFVSYETQKYPSDDQLQTASVVIIPGSGASAYNDEIPWVPKMQLFIQQIYENYPKLKLLGVCFGHQMTAEALGGKVGILSMYRRGVDAISLKKEIHQIPYWNQIIEEEKLDQSSFQLGVTQSHGDYVQKLPLKFQSFAFSYYVANEVVISDDRRIFTLQGHPEYTSLWHIISNSGQVGFENVEKFVQEAKQRYKTHNDYRIWRQIISSFLDD